MPRLGCQAPINSQLPGQLRFLRAKPDKKICRTSGSDPKFVKDALHGGSQVLVVAVDGPWILSSAGWRDFLCGGEQWFDGLVAEHEQRGDRSQSGRHRLIAASRAD